MFALNSGEWSILAFMLLTIFGAQLSGAVGARVARMLVARKPLNEKKP